MNLVLFYFKVNVIFSLFVVFFGNNNDVNVGSNSNYYNSVFDGFRVLKDFFVYLI